MQRQITIQLSRGTLQSLTSSAQEQLGQGKTAQGANQTDRGQGSMLVYWTENVILCGVIHKGMITIRLPPCPSTC